MATAREVYEVRVGGDRPRRRWRWLGALFAGVASEGAFTVSSDVHDVEVVRRSDGDVVLARDRVLPDVVRLLTDDWSRLDEASFAERWLEG